MVQFITFDRGIKMLYTDNQDFNDFIDDVYPAVKIGGLTFSASKILFELDPIAYRLSAIEYIDNLSE